MKTLSEERPGAGWKSRFEAFGPFYERWFLNEGDATGPDARLAALMPERLGTRGRARVAVTEDRTAEIIGRRRGGGYDRRNPRAAMMSFDVFLSHASPDKTAVETLARRLREDGLEPFLDKWHLVPGEPWQEALEEALDDSRTCAVFVGVKLGPWQNEEMRSALRTLEGHPNGVNAVAVLDETRVVSAS